VFENRGPRKIFGPKRNEVIGECRKLRNEWLNDLYCLQSNIPAIKLRRLRLAGHVARVGERKCVYRVTWKTGGGWNVLCKRTFKKWDEGLYWIDLAEDRDQVAGCCDCGNEPLGCIKCQEFLDWLRNYWSLKEAFAIWSSLLS
jgi:hypothetical protein